MKPYRVIVAEDNRIMQDVIRFNLARAGCEVRTAVEGAQALQLLEDRPVDVLVNDCQMPGMSGLELCAAIRAHAVFSSLPIVLCSAKGLEITSETLEQLRLQQVLCKPFSPRSLVEIVLALAEFERSPSMILERVH